MYIIFFIYHNHQNSLRVAGQSQNVLNCMCLDYEQIGESLSVKAQIKYFLYLQKKKKFL